MCSRRGRAGSRPQSGSHSKERGSRVGGGEGGAGGDTGRGPERASTRPRPRGRGPSARWPPRESARETRSRGGAEKRLRSDPPRVPTPSGPGARCAASSPRQPDPAAAFPRRVPRAARPQARGPYLQLGEEDLPPVRVGRHGAPLWTPHPKAAGDAAEGEGGTGAGRGVRTGEKAAS